MTASTEAFTPAGKTLTFAVREDTNDGALTAGILGDEDEYNLKGLPPLSGWLIDVGAHIGSVAVALAVDNPDLRVVAVEAIPDNADLVRENAERNGVADRVFVETAGAAAPGTRTVSITYDYQWVGKPGGDLPVVPENYVNQCRFIGNIFEYPKGQQQATTKKVPALSLSTIMRRYSIERVSLLKIDCEGCEWQFFKDKSIAKVDRIIGEYHGSGTSSPTGMERVHALLDKTHEVTWRRGEDVGLFEAVVR
jgi:FkbM family methyltransferase